MTDSHQRHPDCMDMPCATCAGLDPLHETSKRIASLGWSVTVVGTSPGYAYSVGLASQGLPELIAEESPSMPLFQAASLVNRLACESRERRLLVSLSTVIPDPDDASRRVLLSRCEDTERLKIARRFAPFGLQAYTASYL